MPGIGRVAIDLVLQIHAAVVADFLKLLEDRHYRHHTFADGALALLVRPILQILEAYVEQPLARVGDFPHHVGARSHRMSHVHAQPHARVHVPHRIEHDLGPRKVLVLGALRVDGDLDVELLRQLPFHIRRPAFTKRIQIFRQRFQLFGTSGLGIEAAT
jgi:hypothetical protein